MSGQEPKRCGAKKRDGTPCKARPAPGSKRCRIHGGHPRSGRPPIHGRYSARFRRLDAVAQEAIDTALKDPQLLDLRRPVALQSLIVQDAPLLPDDQLIHDFAMRLSRWRPREGETWLDQPDPTDSELALARMAWLEKSSELTERYGRIQAASSKAAQVTELLSKQLIPIFAELGLRMTKLAHRFVPAAQRADFDEAFRMEVRRCVAEIVAASETK
jgi:hypothetical protein